MFTGIIEETGQVVTVESVQSNRLFRVQANSVLKGLKRGESIAVNGCCQTVETIEQNSFTFQSVPETLQITNLALLKAGDQVNLELAMPLNARLGGHLVLGHIEGMADVSAIQKESGFTNITIKYSSPYLTHKGSVALDGVALTIHAIKDDTFSVQIIPETILKTNIAQWKVGRQVNIETDFMVKTIDHLMRYRSAERST